MKTKIILLILTCWVGVVWGQEKEDKILIVNLTKDDKIPTLLKKNTFIGFKIENVNVFKVTGKADIKTEESNYSLPKWYAEALKKYEEELKNPFNETVRSSGSSTEPTAKEKLRNSLHDKSTLIQSDLFDFYTTYINIKNLTELDNRLNFIIADSIFINKEKTQTDSKQIYLSIYKHEDADYKDYQMIETNILALNKEYWELTSHYSEYESIAKQLSEGNIYASEITNVKLIFDEIQKNKITLIQKAKNGIDWYRKIINSPFEIKIEPIQLSEDINTITPQLKNAKGEVVYSYNPIKIETFGGWKINFSAGYFLSFIGNDNYTSYTNSLGSKEVAKGNTDKITNALGGLLHVYSNQPSKLVKLGISFGVSLADNSSVGFYAGPSLFFLEKNRLVTTFGYSFIKVKRLNTANLTAISDDRYSFINTANTEIQYDPVYKGAWFFGVTYNLSK